MSDIVLDKSRKKIPLMRLKFQNIFVGFMCCCFKALCYTCIHTVLWVLWYEHETEYIMTEQTKSALCHTKCIKNHVDPDSSMGIVVMIVDMLFFYMAKERKPQVVAEWVGHWSQDRKILFKLSLLFLCGMSGKHTHFYFNEAFNNVL